MGRLIKDYGGTSFMNPGKTLYVTDLDGTLLNRNDKISEYSLEAIHSLTKLGMVFTYATARSLVSASVVTKGLKINHPVVVYNGTFIINPESGEVLSSTSFHQEEITYIINLLDKYTIYPVVYSFIEGVEKVSWLPERENEGMVRYLSLRKGDKRLNPVHSIENLYLGQVFYFTCIGEKEELLPIYEILKDNPHYTCILHQELYREEYWCEIIPKEATKANAILKLKEIVGCDKIISFGDAINDIPMFQISDECYAVENAVPELKALATSVIESNDADGVVKWLQKNCTKP